MFVHQFKIYMNSLYVCLVVSWLTSLQKSGLQGYLLFWMRCFSYFFVHISGMLVHQFKILVSLFVCQLAYFITENRLIKVYLQFWMIYLSENFWRLSWNKFLMSYLTEFLGHLPGMFVQQIKIIPNFLYVCQSVSWLTSLLKLGYYGDISSSG